MMAFERWSGSGAEAGDAMSGGMRQRVVVRERRGYLNMEGDAPHRVQERRRMANSRGILHDDRHLIDVRHDGGIGPSKRGSLRLRSSAEAWAGTIHQPASRSPSRGTASRRTKVRVGLPESLCPSSTVVEGVFHLGTVVRSLRRDAPGGRAALV